MRLWALLVLVLGSKRGGEGSLCLSQRPRADAGQEGRDPEGPLQENMSAGRREGQTAQVSGCPGPAGRRRWVGKPSDGAARGRLVLWLGRVHTSQAPGVSEGPGKATAGS